VQDHKTSNLRRFHTHKPANQSKVKMSNPIENMWVSIQTSAKNFGDNAAKEAKKLGENAAKEAKKAKIRTDILMINRSIDARKRKFGVSMYDSVVPLSSTTEFYASNDKLMEIIRPKLISAQKEVQALAARRVIQAESLTKAEAEHAAAFPTKAENFGEKFMNFAKGSVFHGNEAKIKTEMSVTDRMMKGYKEDFGVALYDSFAEAEDNEGFLPTDRQIRSVYDTCRQDLTAMEQEKKQKNDELMALGGESSQTDSFEPPTVQQNTATTTTNTTTITSLNNTTSVSTTNTSSSDNGGYGTTNIVPQPILSSPEPYSSTNPQQYVQGNMSPATDIQVAGSGMFSYPVASNPNTTRSSSDPFANCVPDPSMSMNKNTTTTKTTPDPMLDLFSNNTSTTQYPSTSSQQDVTLDLFSNNTSTTQYPSASSQQDVTLDLFSNNTSTAQYPSASSQQDVTFF